MEIRSLVLSLVSGAVIAGSLTTPALAAERGQGTGPDPVASASKQAPRPAAAPKPAAAQKSAATPKSAARVFPKRTHPSLSGDIDIVTPAQALTCSSADRRWAVLQGPAQIVIGGWVQCAGGVATFTAAAGRGTVGGRTLDSDSFSGTLTATKGKAPQGAVTVAVPDAPVILPNSKRALSLTMKPANGSWNSVVSGSEVSRAGSVRMTGPLAADGTFRLLVTGSVRISSGSIAVRGSLTSASRTSPSHDSWLVQGTGRAITVPGALIYAPQVTLSSEAAGITGSARVRINQLGVVAPAQLRIVGAGTWSATVSGSATPSIQDARIESLTLQTSRLSGTVGMRAGVAQWALKLPMSLVADGITLRGSATLSDPRSLTLTAYSAIGDVFGLGRPVVFTHSVGSTTITPTKVIGRMGVRAWGEQIVDMPDSWASNTDLLLTPRKTGSRYTMDAGVHYGMAIGPTKFNLSGPIPATGPINLRASGNLQIGETAIPIHGSYVGGDSARMDIKADTADAPAGYATLSPGARIYGTTFHYATDAPAAGLAVRSSGMPTVKVTTESTSAGGQGGNITLQVNDVTTSNGDDTIELSGTWSYDDSKYTITVYGEGTGYWVPYQGLDIPIDSIEGVVYLNQLSMSGVTSWDVTTGTVTWAVGDGITMTDSLRISSNCPSDTVKSCPTTTPTDAFYVSGTSTVMNIPVMSGVTIPSLTASGAFLSDGSWVRWDGDVAGGDTIEVDGPADSDISMESATVTIFSGATRDDSIPNLQMPDLSAFNVNNVNVQACGTFQVVILDINTGKSNGCVGITSKGKAMGQTGTGGTAANGGAVTPVQDDSGLHLNSDPQVNGYGYSDIQPASTPTKTTPTMKLYNQLISLVPNQNNLSANVTIPGELMKSFGSGVSTDTTLVATGWFSPKTSQFGINLAIPINLQVSGADLQTIDVSIDRINQATNHYYQFGLGATGEVKIQSHHYPFQANLTLKAGTQNTANVNLAVTGSASTQPIGTFDDTSLLSQGDFEPPNTSLIDGSFDGTAKPNDFADGGFEAGLPPTNLVADPGFESAASPTLLSQDASTFDGSVSGNLLPNPSYDDTDLLTNGDFEGWSGVNPSKAWPAWSAYQSASLSTLSTPGPDSDVPGSQALCVNNTSSSTTALGGALQLLGNLPNSNATYQLSGYVTSGTSSATSANVYILGDSAMSSVASTSVSAPVGSWQAFSVTYSPNGTDYAPSVLLNAKSKTTACFDNVSLAIISGSPSQPGGMPGVFEPDVVEDFDSSLSSWDLTSSGISRSDTGNGSLATSGCKDYWAFKNSSRGDVNGNFDMSVNIYYPGTSGREIADVGFYLSGAGADVNGYIFRMETEHSDGGFYRVSNGSLSAFGGTAPNLAFQTWYTLHIVGSNGYVTAQITKVSDGSVVYTDAEQLPSSGLRTEGVFGQWPDGACTSQGQLWDDFRIATPSINGAAVIFNPGNARSAPGYASLTGSVAGWDYLTSSGIDPSANQTYTYSAWLRSSTSSSMSGNLRISTVGGSSYETRTQPFTVGSSWTQVRVTLPLQADHTDIRVGVTDGGAAGTVYVDDQVLQMVPYLASPSGSSAPTMDVVSLTDQQVNLVGNPSFESNTSGWNAGGTGSVTRSTTQAWTGSASGQLTRANGSTGDDYVEYVASGVAPSTAYTVSAYVWLPSGAQASDVYDSRDLLWAVDYSGAGNVTSMPADFTQTGSWQRLSTTITTSSTANSLNVRLYAPTGGGWYADGIMVERGASLDDYFAGSQDLTTSSNSLLFTPYDTNSQIWNTVGTPNKGSVYTLSADVRSVNGSSFPLALAITDGNGTTTTKQVTVTGEWTSVGPLQITSAGGSNLKVGFEAVNGTGGLYLDNVKFVASETSSSQTAGTLGALSTPPGWTQYTSYATQPVLINSPENAHTGNAFMNVVYGTDIIMWDDTSVVPGQQYAGSAWIKVPSGYESGAATFFLYTMASNGAVINSKQVTPTNLVAGTWTQVPLVLPVTQGGVAKLALAIFSGDPSERPLSVDDVSMAKNGLSIVDPWSISGNTGLVSLTDESVAHSGENYLEVNTYGGSGAAVLNSTVTPATGARTFAAWVKSPTSTPVSGTLSLQAGSKTDSVNFTATSTWSQVIVTVPVTAGASTNLTHTITVSGQNTLLVDDLESRDLYPFVPQGSGVRGLVVQDPAGSATPPAYLRFTTSSANTGVSAPTTVDANGDPISAHGGSTYTLRAQIKAPAGTTGTFALGFGSQQGTLADPQLQDGDGPTFTATGDWQSVEVTFVAPGSGNFSSITPSVTLNSAGTLQLDTVTISPVLIDQDQPWQIYAPTGTNVTWGVYDDPPNAHDGTLGHLTMSKTGSSDAGLVKYLQQVPEPGDTYSATAWVRTATDDTATFRFELWAEGGSGAAEEVQQIVTATQDWQLIQLRLPVKNANHTELRASLISMTAGSTFYVDDVAVVKNQWVAADNGTQDILNDGGGAYEGSGYARLTNTSSTAGAVATLYADVTGPFSGMQTLTAHVRSGTDDTVTGYLMAANGCTASSPQFTAGADWQQVQLTCTPSGTVQTLRMQLQQNTPGGVLEIDSVTLSNEPLQPINFNNVYGVTTPLNHPNTGYQYLWDDAFGIPGTHLWGFTAQVTIDTDGTPGLGLQATVYQDPTKVPNLLYGTDWIYGNAVVNIDEMNPCFDFAFQTDGGSSGISVANGALKADDFDITFAPRGCAVGEYTVAPGASVSFDALVGDGTVHFALDLTKNAKGQPTFTGDVAVANLNIGGIDYRNMIMSVIASPTDDSVTYVADMQLPMGGFTGNFDMNGTKTGVSVDGAVGLTNWGWTSSSGKGLKIDDFNFDFTMDVGKDNCGTFTAAGSGNAKADFAMATDLDFDGSLSMECGILTALQFRFDYTHGAITEDFFLNYDSSSLTLAGGVQFNFDRKVSWKVLGYRYHRTARIGVMLDFSMDVTNPSSSSATLAANIQVAGGDGTFQCSINGQPDDSCNIRVRVNSPVIGNVYFNETW